MTGLWEIVTPSAGVNYARNPSLTKSSDGWTAYSASSGAGAVARTGDAAMQGFFGMHVDKTGTTGDYGVTLPSEANNLFVSGQYVTMSVFVIVPTGTRATFTANVFNPGLLSTAVVQDGPYSGRLEATVGPLTGNSTSIFGRAYIPDSYGDYIYADGFQIEADTVTFSASTFFDGDTQGCHWNGLYYDDRSIRPATARDGGAIANFDDYGLYITSMSNIGMPPVQHNMDGYALQDGALYRDSHVPQRVFALTCTLIGSALADLHDKRRALVDLFKTDVGGEDQEFLLRYAGSGETLQIKARYDSGLEFGNKNGFSENLSLRFIAVDPYWRKTHNVGIDIDALRTEPTLYKVAARIRGEWDSMVTSGTGPDNGEVYAIAHYEGRTYIGGSFTTVNSDANMSYIAVLENGTWNALGSGANGDVNALVVTAKGELFAGGAFTVMGGVANTNRIARWDGSTWNALTTGANGDVEALAVSKGNLLYAGGAFTTAGGAAHSRFAIFDIIADTWKAVPTTGPDNNSTLTISVATNGDVYIGGSFTAVNSVSNTGYLAKWNGAAWAAVSTGMDDVVRAIESHPNGNIYAGGDFTTAGGVTVGKLTEWNGTTFLDMSGGIVGSDSVYSLKMLEDDILAIGGNFSLVAGSLPVSRFVYWNGSTYYPADWRTTSAFTIYAIGTGGEYEIIIGGDFTSLRIASVYTVTNNGTRTAYPRFSLTPNLPGAGYAVWLLWLAFYETGGKLVFNLLSIEDGESLLVDTRPGSVGVGSKAIGNRLSELNRVSSFADMLVLPGDSKLIVAGDQTASATFTMSMIWDELYWSADGD